MITDMSHDLRTPLTSIMIYTEILKKKKYKDEEQMQEYIEKIEQKTQRIKQLSERIFEYSLVTSEMEVALSEPNGLKLCSMICCLKPVFIWSREDIR